MSKFKKQLKKVSDNDPELIELSCKKVNDAKIEELAKAMKKNTHINNLKIQNDGMSEKGVKALATLLSDHSIITHLKIYNNTWSYLKRVGKEIKQEIIEALDNTFDEVVREDRCVTFDTESVNILAEALKSNRTLTSLKLIRQLMSAENLNRLIEALFENQTIKTLGLPFVFTLSSQEKYRENLFTNFAVFLEINNVLTKLDLSVNAIVDWEVAVLSLALHYNQTLKELYLCRNNINLDGMLELAEMLNVNKTLTLLDIQNNKDLTDLECIEAFVDALKNNYSLLELKGVSHPEITKCLARNQSLAKLLPELSACQRKIWHLHSEEILGLARCSLNQSSHLSRLHITQTELTISVLQKITKLPYDETEGIYNKALSICQKELIVQEDKVSSQKNKKNVSVFKLFHFSNSKNDGNKVDVKDDSSLKYSSKKK